ncbi:MAG: DUF819 family protein, partial [Bacteroidetes bacterium]
MPWVGMVLYKKPFFKHWMSPVVFCYGIGIIISNLRPFPLNDALSNYVTMGTIVLAIPLLLFSAKILKWLKYTGKGLISFLLCVVSAMVGASIAWYFLGDSVDSAWRLSGMLVGIYTGGTPNMQAIGMALQASQENIILVNAADMLMGGAYLIFLSTVAHQLLKGILPDFEGNDEANPEFELGGKKFNVLDSLKGIGLSIVIAGIAVAIPYFLLGSMENIALIILGLTAISIAAA